MLVVSAIIFAAGPQDEFTAQISLADKGELVVAMSKDMPGLLAGDGGTFGYQFDLLEAYAGAAGLPLRVVMAADAHAAVKKLNSGKADMVLALSQNLSQEQDKQPLYSTSFVVVGRRADALPKEQAAESSFGWLREKKVLISHGFKSSKTYGAMLDSLKGGGIFVSSAGCAETVKSLTAGKYDYYVCERSAAQLMCAMDRNIRKVHEFGENIEVSAMFGPHIADLETDFTAWLAEYRHTNEYAALRYRYFDKGATERFAGQKAGAAGAISPYDHVMREVCEREGADWRLMAAIAYCESRFNADVVSHKGAKGLMQIMPIVARQFGVPDEEVLKPEVNVTLGVKLLNSIEDMMDIPAEVAYQDRMSLVLASYNCGVGHVADARRLAAKYNMNPNSWDDVAYFLVKKSEPEYFGDEVVRNGVFRGSKQTLGFVKGVMGRYTSYCTLAVK